MADNDWINGYLEAILDAGERIDHVHYERTAVEASTAAKYFVEEVVGHDESALYNTWIRATATKNAKERSGRLENLCWRIWQITRKKKEIQWEDAKRLAHQHMEREQAHKAATEDMPEEFSEGDRPDQAFEGTHHSDGGSAHNHKISDGPQSAEVQAKQRRLYLVLIRYSWFTMMQEARLYQKQQFSVGLLRSSNFSTYQFLEHAIPQKIIGATIASVDSIRSCHLCLHGLVRGENMELGRDSDTGGQVKYVVEFARALAMMPEVYRVDLLTRQICSPDVDWSYGEPTEMLTSGSYDDGEEMGESSGAYIIRIPCGPKDQYIRKELLWPYIQEFVDGALSHILNMAKALGEQLADRELLWPHVIHGHYADAGNAAASLSGALNVPMVLTGHSLGRNKLEQLLKQGRQSKDDINTTYKMMRRIEAEEISLDAAELVITSTKQEVEQQWGLYDGFDVKLERVLKARTRRGVSCHGRFMPRMVVIPPGMDFRNVIVQEAGDILETDTDAVSFANTDLTVVTQVSPGPNPPIWDEIMRFLTNPHKPIILALARPDSKKNITTLLKAFGECRPLRELANLTLIMGNRDDIDEMSAGSSAVLTAVLKLIDKFDLYGQVAYPKHHKQSDVPDIYRLAAKTKGVFINPALVEPFGLTLIEAAAHGLPMVATRNGGPVDIHRVLNNGLLLDPHDQKAISAALLKLVSDRSLWHDCRKNGLKNIHLYSWPEHCRTYLSRIAVCRMRHPQWQKETRIEKGGLDSQQDSLRDESDISLQLSVDGEKLQPGSLTSPIIIAQVLGNCNSQNGQQKPEQDEALTGSINKDQKMNTTENMAAFHSPGSISTRTALSIRKRKSLVVFALDSYDPTTGEPSRRPMRVIQEIFKAVRQAKSRSVGFVISSALTVSETLSQLKANGAVPQDFDALICGSGSQLYYPGGFTVSEENFDLDYKDHIDYRWGYEGLRKSMPRLMSSDEEIGPKGARSLVEDEEHCNSHCLTYKLTNISNAPAIAELRQRLRMRGLRCHVTYSHNASKLHVLPLFASRSQALRYFFVRWGVELDSVYVIVGETGDTDYEDLLMGAHKKLILKEAAEGSSENKLRASGKYQRSDPTPSDGPKILTAESSNFESVLSALQKLGLKI